MSEIDPKIAAELKAMQTIAGVLDELSDDETSRILRWACDRYGVAA